MVTVEICQVALRQSGEGTADKESEEDGAWEWRGRGRVAELLA